MGEGGDGAVSTLTFLFLYLPHPLRPSLLPYPVFYFIIMTTQTSKATINRRVSAAEWPARADQGALPTDHHDLRLIVLK